MYKKATAEFFSSKSLLMQSIEVSLYRIISTNREDYISSFPVVCFHFPSVAYLFAVQFLI
jgi:hypothetical protein